MATKTWVGAAGGGDGVSYSDPDNWAPPGAPTFADDVIIGTSDAIVGSPGQAGTLLVDAVPTELTTFGAVLNINTPPSDPLADDSFETVIGTGDPDDPTGNVTVGQFAAGQINVSSGARARFGGDLIIGQFSDSSGQVTVDGMGTVLSVGGGITVGKEGSGTLFLTDGANVFANVNGIALGQNLVVGEFNDGFNTATVSLSVGSNLEANGNITLVSGFIDVLGGSTLKGDIFNGSGESVIGRRTTIGEGTVFPFASMTVDGLFSDYTDGNLVIGDDASGSLNVNNLATANLANVAVGRDSDSGDGFQSDGSLTISGGAQVTAANLSIAETADSFGFVQVLDFGSRLIADNVYVGGSALAAGGFGELFVDFGGAVEIADTLTVWNEGRVSFFGAADGSAIVIGPDPEIVLLLVEPQEQGGITLRPGGTLNLFNGVIDGGDVGFLNLAGGTFNITPGADQIDNQHSLLLNIELLGQVLNVDGGVLNLEGRVFRGEETGSPDDELLLTANDSLLTLQGGVGGEVEQAGFNLSQTIRMQRTALTVGPGSSGIEGAAILDILPEDPFFHENFDPVEGAPDPAGAIIGSGAIFANYNPTDNPGAPGFFSGDVTLLNRGLVEANTLGNEDLPSSVLNLLTNTITNFGVFRAAQGATLNIGNSEQPLDATHVFTNLLINPFDTSDVELFQGVYDVLPDGVIAINGDFFDGLLLNALNPITRLGADLFLTGNARLEINGTDIRQSLTHIGNGLTSSTLHLFGTGGPDEFNFDNEITVDEGALFVDSARFVAPNLIVTPLGLISGNGEIDAPVEMNGNVLVSPNIGFDTLRFLKAVTGLGGTFDIDPLGVLRFDDTVGAPGDAQSDRFIRFGGVGGPDDARETLRLEREDFGDTFRGTLAFFDSADLVYLPNVHATSAELDAGVAGQLNVFGAFGDLLGVLQFDPFDPRFDGLNGDDETFAVGNDGNGGTFISLFDAANAPPELSFEGASGATEDSSGTLVEMSSTTVFYGDDIFTGNPGLQMVVEANEALGVINPIALTGTVLGMPGDPTPNPFNVDFFVANRAIDYLGANDQRIDQFALGLSDGKNTTVQPFDVSIQGVNDAPIVGLQQIATSFWFTVGDASPLGAVGPDGSLASDVYQLTPDLEGQAGAIWQGVDLSRSLEVHARLFFGDFGPGFTGLSDGIAFVFQNTGVDAIGDAGESLGIEDGFGPNSGIPDAVGVKFDTFPNTGEPLTPFAEFFTGGNPNNEVGSEQLIPHPLANGGWHDLVITFDPGTSTLAYVLDGVVMDSAFFDPLAAFGTEQVTMGFTGATGGAHTEQRVQLVSVQNGLLDQSTGSFVGFFTENANVFGDPTQHTTDFTLPFFDADLSDSAGYASAVTAIVASGEIAGLPDEATLLSFLTSDGIPFKSAGFNWGSASFNFAAADSFFDYLGEGEQVVLDYTIEITDPFGGVGAMTDAIRVIVEGTNDAPVAVDDNTYSVGHNGVLTITDPALGILANDTDPDLNDVLQSLMIVDGPDFGLLTLNPDGTFTYDPNGTFVGLDTFTYVANDGTTDSNVATVTIDVTNFGPATIGSDGPYSVDEDMTLVVNAANGVLANDTDADGDPITASLFSGPDSLATAFFQLNADGSFEFTPVADFNGMVSFSYFATDGFPTGGGSPAFVTVEIEVNPVNDAPVFNNFEQPASDTTAEDTTLHLAADLDQTISDVDAGGSDLRLTLDVNNGTLALTGANPGLTIVDDDGADGTIIVEGTLAELNAAIHNGFDYAPNLNFNGLDTLTVTVNDLGNTGAGGAQSASITVDIDVTPVDDAPVISGEDTGTVQEDVTLIASGMLSVVDPDTGESAFVPANVAGVFGSFEIDAAGDWTYTLNNGDPIVQALRGGSDEFENFLVQSVDGTTHNVEITVFGTNDAAVIGGDTTGTVQEDVDLVASGTLTVNDIDTDEDAFQSQSNVAGSFGSLTITALGDWTYTLDDNDLPAVQALNNGDFLTDMFTVFAADGTPQELTITINGTDEPVGNTAPVADADGPYNATEDTQLTVDAANGVLAGDTDADGDGLTAQLGTGPANALSFTLNPDGSFTYQGAANFNGVDSFTYRAFDGSELSNEITVEINVAAVNDAPVFNNFEQPASDATAEDTTLHLAADLGQTISDVDAGGDDLRLTLDVNNGTLALTGANPGLTIVDGDGTDGTIVVEGTLAELNDAIHNGFDYAPNLNFNGLDTFTVTVNDLGNTGLGGAQSASITVDLTVTEVNDAPVADDETATVAEDTANNVIDVLTGDVAGPANEVGQTLTVTQASALHGAVTINGDGTLSYTPDANYFGADTITYTVADNGTTDGLADPLTDIGEVAVTVTGIADVPDAVDDALSAVAEDSGLRTISAADLLANDTDADNLPPALPNDGLTVTGVANAIGGTAVLNGGNVDFTPFANFNGAASFEYTIDDGTGLMDTAMVSFNVTAVNDAPVADDDSVTTDEDMAVAGNVLANDDDVEGDDLDAMVVSGPSNGSLDFNEETGAFTYTPFANFNGPDSFTYRVNDGTDDGNIATVSITVDPVNDAPEGADNTVTTTEDTAYTFTVADFGFSDPNDVPANEFARVRIASLPLAGSLTLGGIALTAGAFVDVVDILAGLLEFTPAANANGAAHASFTFQVEDDGGTDNGGVNLDPTPNTIIVDVTAVNDAPVANGDTFGATLGNTLNVAAPGVLGNDSDVENDPLTAALIDGPDHGTLSFNPDGSFTYTPDVTLTSDVADSFTYKANDGDLDSAAATVTINVAIGPDTFDDFKNASANTGYQLGATSATVVNTIGGRQTGLTGEGGVVIDNVIAGSGNDTITGNNNGGILNGGAGNDTIRAGTGNDFLIGGLGNDRQTGGLGDDTFVFRPGFGKDTVTDFQVGDVNHHDTLDLRGLGFNTLDEVFAATDGAASAVIHVGVNDITLQNVTEAQLFLAKDYGILI